MHYTDHKLPVPSWEQRALSTCHQVHVLAESMKHVAEGLQAKLDLAEKDILDFFRDPELENFVQIREVAKQRAKALAEKQAARHARALARQAEALLLRSEEEEEELRARALFAPPELSSEEEEESGDAAADEARAEREAAIKRKALSDMLEYLGDWLNERTIAVVEDEVVCWLFFDT